MFVLVVSHVKILGFVLLLVLETIGLLELIPTLHFVFFSASTLRTWFCWRSIFVCLLFLFGCRCFSSSWQWWNAFTKLPPQSRLQYLKAELWLDAVRVTLLATSYFSAAGTTVLRWTQEAFARLSLGCSATLACYAKMMGCVDRFNRALAAHRLHWHRELFLKPILCGIRLYCWFADMDFHGMCVQLGRAILAGTNRQPPAQEEAAEDVIGVRPRLSLRGG